ncbi:MAG: DUF1232 domain-containing protein [Clostridia bacterium]|nr:DUF1232 domain-containing protein [Clostridia bacterium]
MPRKKLIDEEKLEQKAQEEFNEGIEKAQVILEDEDKVEKLLEKLEKKLTKVPLVGDKLSYVPTLISLLRSYVKKEYTDIPVGSMIGVVSALTYWLAPIDILPDFLGIFGFTDDAIVMGFCLNMIKSDLDDYIAWREFKENTLTSDDDFTYPEQK